MRTTVSLDDDVVAAVRDLRESSGLGLSEAINALARRGLATRTPTDIAFASPVFEMHAQLDLTNIAEVLDVLDHS